MSRGIMYLVWGNYNQEELKKSIQSIEKTGLPYEVVISDGDTFWENKSQIFEKSPFTSTLYLDTDTLVLDEDLNFGFEMAEKFGIAMTNDPITHSNRWGEAWRGFVEWNTGVIFFHKCDLVQRLSDAWRQGGDMGNPRADQQSFSAIIQNTKIQPFWLQNNWNFFAGLSPSPITGEIKIWHSHDTNPHENVKVWNKMNQGLHKKVAQYQYPGYFKILFD